MKITNDEGEEIEVFTQDEVAAQIAEKEAAIEAAKKEAEEAKEHLQKRTDEFVKAKVGFKKFEEMTEKEKAAMTEREKETMLRIEQMETTRKKEVEDAKEAMFAAAAKGDEKVLEKLREKFGLVQMAETTVAEVREKINAVTPWVYAELGIIERQPTPIEATIVAGGAAPRSKDEPKRFAETPEGEAKAKQIFPGVLPDKQ